MELNIKLLKVVADILLQTFNPYIIYMSYIKDFFKEHGAHVLTLVIIFLTILTIFSILGVNFNKIPNHHVKKVVTIESFGSAIDADGTCNKYKDDPDKIDKLCQKLTPKNCSACSCCVLLNGINCAGGDHTGPTFSKRNGKSVDYDYYHHKSKCNGKCPSE